MVSRLGDRIGHAWLPPFAAAPGLRRRRQQLLELAEGEVLDLGDRRAVAELAERPDGSLDAVSSIFALCSVPRPDATLAQVYRALRLGGRFVFLEHVPDWPGARSAADVVGTTWRWMGGCDPRRDVTAAVRRSGLVIGDLDRFTVPTLAIPLRRCVAGVAVRLSIQELP